MTDATNTPPERARRRKPERTKPQRNMLGIFGQGGESGLRHPLGFDQAPDPAPSAPRYSDPALRDASDLIDRHIAEAAQQDGGTASGNPFDATTWLSGMMGGQELTGQITQIVKLYSEMASLWIEAVGDLHSRLTSSGTATPNGAAHQPAIPSPVLSLRAACPVEVRVEMFRPGTDLRLLPLMRAADDDPAAIRSVAVDADRLRIQVPADQTPGRYYGLILSAATGPVGAVFLEVFGPEDVAP